jgi:type IV pilus assembly protein PilM
VDIGASSVKLVGLSRDGDGYRVDHLAVEALEPDAVDQGVIRDPSGVSEAIRRVWYQSAAKTKSCVMAVPITSVFSRVIYMPAGLSEQELESQVQIEAGQIVPFELDEVSLDFQVLGAAPGDGDQIEVLLAATRTENVNQLESIIDEAGLELAIVDIEKYALVNCYAALFIDPSLAGKTVALVNIGHHGMVFSAVADDRELYVKDVNFGAGQLQRQVQDSLGEDADVAQALAAPDEDLESGVIEPFRHQLVMQINRALQAYATSSKYKRIEQVMLCGGGSRLHGLVAALEDELSLPVSVPDVADRLKLGNKASRRLLQDQGPSLALALGLALRGCN